MKTIDTFNFSSKRALIRVDFNVPLNDQMEVTDNTRIKAAIPTIKKILKDGGSVVLMSHLGRPKNGPEEKFSLRHIVPALEGLLGQSVVFAGDCIGEEALRITGALAAGTVVLLDNLRFYKEETAGDVDFAQKLSAHGDVYVNDAFGTAHRAHASTTIVAQFFPVEKLFGYLIEGELRSIDKVLLEPESPYTAIIGGAKVSSKISIINNLLDRIDRLIIGGGMAYTFAKAQGGEIGNSLVEDDYLPMAKEILETAKAKGVEVILPSDTLAADAFSNDANVQKVATAEIPDGWMGLDIGPDAIAQCRETLLTSKTILWNGPMGVFEMPAFQSGTEQLAEAVAQATENGAFSLIGGGDSVAAANQFEVADRVSYISTGGGALLEYMEGKVLPGIQAIRE